MTEDEYRRDTWSTMHLFIGRQSSKRKVLLAYCACCRCTWEHVTLECNRSAVAASERYADGHADEGELGAYWAAARFEPVVYHDWSTGVAGPINRPDFYQQLCPAHPHEYEALNAFRSVRTDELQARWKAVWIECGLDVFGSVFHPRARIEPRWRTTDVLLLARGIYEDRAFDRMPILADALQDAGCDDDEVLAHCRETEVGSPPKNRTHVRGCWVLDLILERE